MGETAAAEQDTEIAGPDFTGTILSPVTVDERGTAIRHAADYLHGECVARYIVAVRSRRR